MLVSVFRIFLLALALNAKLSFASCDAPPKVLFAPAFGHNFIQGYFNIELKAIEAVFNCPPIIVSTKSFDEFFGLVKRREYAFILSPSMLNDLLSQKGYDAHMSLGLGDGLIIAHKSLGLQNIQQLSGQTVHLNDPLSQATAEWYRIENKLGIKGQYVLAFGGRLESLLLDVLNAEVEITFTAEVLYKKLPSVLKSKLVVLYKHNMVAPGSLLVNQKLASHKVAKLVAIIAEKNLNWVKGIPDPYEIPEPMRRRLTTKLGLN